MWSSFPSPWFMVGNLPQPDSFNFHANEPQPLWPLWRAHIPGSLTSCDTFRRFASEIPLSIWGLVKYGAFGVVNIQGDKQNASEISVQKGSALLKLLLLYPPVNLPKMVLRSEKLWAVTIHGWTQQDWTKCKGKGNLKSNYPTLRYTVSHISLGKSLHQATPSLCWAVPVSWPGRKFSDINCWNHTCHLCTFACTNSENYVIMTDWYTSDRDPPACVWMFLKWLWGKAFKCIFNIWMLWSIMSARWGKSNKNQVGVRMKSMSLHVPTICTRVPWEKSIISSMSTNVDQHICSQNQIMAKKTLQQEKIHYNSA